MTAGRQAALGTIVAIATLGLSLWIFFRSPAPALTAEVTFGLFELPPDLVADIKDLRETLGDNAALQKNLSLVDDLWRLEGPPEKRAATAEQIAQQVASFLREKFPLSIPEPYGSLGGYWAAIVTNQGNKMAQDVVLVLPNTKYVQIERDSQPIVSAPAGPRILLGALQPREAVTVTAWTTIIPSRIWAGGTKLTHSEGTGNVDVMTPVGPFWGHLAQYWFIYMLFSPLAAFIVLSVLAAIGRPLYVSFGHPESSATEIIPQSRRSARRSRDREK